MPRTPAKKLATATDALDRKTEAARVTRNRQNAKGRTVRGKAAKDSKLIAGQIIRGERELPEELYDELPADATPLDILVMAMRRAYLIGGSLMAAPYAEKAAPYVHGKISSIELKNPLGGGGAADGKSGGAMPFLVEFVEPSKKD